jgi:hypothetical protein
MANFESQNRANRTTDMGAPVVDAKPTEIQLQDLDPNNSVYRDMNRGRRHAEPSVLPQFTIDGMGLDYKPVINSPNLVRCDYAPMTSDEAVKDLKAGLRDAEGARRRIDSMASDNRAAFNLASGDKDGFLSMYGESSLSAEEIKTALKGKDRLLPTQVNGLEFLNENFDQFKSADGNIHMNNLDDWSKKSADLIDESVLNYSDNLLDCVDGTDRFDRTNPYDSPKGY